jgi:hypothetical protein
VKLCEASVIVGAKVFNATVPIETYVIVGATVLRATALKTTVLIET